MAGIILLILAGCCLLILETLLPGGIAGIAGGVCILVGIVTSYTKYGILTGTGVLIGTLFTLVILFGLYLAFFPKTKIGRKFALGGSSGPAVSEKSELIGKKGVAITPLRPSGMARIDGKRIDVVTQGEFIELGTPVKVIGVEGMRVIVRADQDLI